MNASLSEQLSSALGVTKPVETTALPSIPEMPVVSAGKMFLDADDERVLIRATIPKRAEKLVPGWVWRKRPQAESEHRPLAVRGEQFFPLHKNVDVDANLRRHLVREGFTLVDGRFVPAGEERSYHEVRFTFYRTVYGVDDAYREILDREVGPSLDILLRGSYWNVSGWDNPLVRGGEVVEGKSTLSFNIDFPSMRVWTPKTRVLTIKDGEILLR